MTTSNTTNTRSSAKKFAFTYNHLAKKIVGTDVAFAKAGIPGSDLETELMARMNGQPTYTFEVIETEKKPAKKTYAGLTMEVMETYLAIYQGELANEMRTEFAKMKVKHNKKEMSYSTIKSWFLDLFPHFNVNKAKKAIQDHKLKEAKAPHKVIKVAISVSQPADQRAAGHE